MSAHDLVQNWAEEYRIELGQRHGSDHEAALREACEQAMSYKWGLTWISTHSSEVANLQAYASMCLGQWLAPPKAEA